MRIAIILCLLLCAGCSQTGLLTRQDYQTSQQEFTRGDDEGALLDFPRSNEDGDFITSMERGYLSLIRGRPRIAGLREQEGLPEELRLQEKQVGYRLPREARTVFDGRLPQDYRPSEYELIWLHLLLGWGYADQGKYTDAAEEARLARNLLTRPPSANRHFDDPMLRLFLAGLWTMCGQWQEARADLRAASAQDDSLDWARELAARERAPAQLFIVMGGPGPDVAWDPAFGSNPLRSARTVKFVLRGRKSALTVQGAHGMLIDTRLSPDASHWYTRHLAREGDLDNMLQDVAYGGKATANGIEATAIFAGDTGKYVVEGIAGGALVGVLGGSGVLSGANAGTAGTGDTGTGATGGAVYYSPAETKKFAAFGAALGAVVGVAYGATNGFEKGAAEFRKSMDPATRYRFVRYLPEYLWLGWTDQPIAYPVTLRTVRQTAAVARPTVINGTAVTVAHLADSRQASCIYRNYNGSSDLITPPDAAGDCPQQPNI